MSDFWKTDCLLPLLLPMFFFLPTSFRGIVPVDAIFEYYYVPETMLIVANVISFNSYNTPFEVGIIFTVQEEET